MKFYYKSDYGTEEIVEEQAKAWIRDKMSDPAASWELLKGGGKVHLMFGTLWAKQYQCESADLYCDNETFTHDPIMGDGMTFCSERCKKQWLEDAIGEMEAMGDDPHGKYWRN